MNPTVEPGRLRCRGDKHRPGCAHLGNDETRRYCSGDKHRPGCKHQIGPYFAKGPTTRPRKKGTKRTPKSGLIRGKTASSNPKTGVVTDVSPYAESGGNWGVGDRLYERNSVHGFAHGKVVGRVRESDGSVIRSKDWAWGDPCPLCLSVTEFGYCVKCSWVCSNALRPAPEPIGVL